MKYRPLGRPCKRCDKRFEKTSKYQLLCEECRSNNHNCMKGGLK